MALKRGWPLLSLLGLVACVPSVPHFVTHAEARAGHPAEDTEYGAVDPWVRETDLPRRPDEEATQGRTLPRAAYWHWNGVAYERIEASWDEEHPAYLWPWQANARAGR